MEMKKVVCINDKNLPEGARVSEGAEYTVERNYINQFGQRTYILSGTVNEGFTSKGLRWIGYDAVRFKNLDNIYSKNEEVETNVILN